MAQKDLAVHRHPPDRCRGERRAQQLVAVSFYLLCAYLAVAVFIGLAANVLFGAWWLDGTVALGIAGWAVIEGRRAWAGQNCACVS